MIGQTDTGFDLQGKLKIIDRAPTAIPIEVLIFRIHPLKGGLDIEAHPDRDGRFNLNNIRPGFYSLTFPAPGRIQSFRIGVHELAAERFELSSAGEGVISLVISDKSGDLSIKIKGLPTGQGNLVALLAPADPHLTLRESCYLNSLSGSQTTFRFIPVGKYRIFIFDAQFQQEVSAYAPRRPGFLENEATPVEVSDDGQTVATATYLNGAVIKKAIEQVSSTVH